MLKSNGFNVIEISNNIIQQSDIKLSKIPKASDKLAKIMPNIFNLPTNIKDLDKC